MANLSAERMREYQRARRAKRKQPTFTDSAYIDSVYKELLAQNPEAMKRYELTRRLMSGGGW